MRDDVVTVDMQQLSDDRDISATGNAAPRADGAPMLEKALLVASLAAAAIFTVVGIARPVWLDEANSILIASQSPAGILQTLGRDNNLPLFYFLLAGWMRLFGDSEIAVRSLTAILYLAGCGVGFLIGLHVSATRRGGAYSAFFYLSSALAVRQTHNIRMYSLLGLLSGLSTLAFLRLFWQRDRSAGAWAFYVLVNAAGLLTHVWFVFVLFAQLATLTAMMRRELWRWAVAGTLAALPFAILWGRAFAGQLRNGATDWMPQLRPLFFLHASLEFYVPLATLMLYFLALTAVRAHRDRGALLLAAIFAVSLATPLAVSLVRPIYWPGRYTVIALAPLAAFLGCALAKHLPRRILSGMCLLLLVVQVPNHIRARETAPDTLLPADQTDRATAQFLLAHAAPGDAVVFTSLTRAAADYYFHRAGAAQRFHEISYPREVAEHQGWLDLTLTPARRAALEEEADATVRDLQSVAARGGAIWLYDGYATNLSTILKQRIDRAFRPRGEHPLQGPYHTRLLEYRTGVSPK